MVLLPLISSYVLLICVHPAALDFVPMPLSLVLIPIRIDHGATTMPLSFFELPPVAAIRKLLDAFGHFVTQAGVNFTHWKWSNRIALGFPRVYNPREWISFINRITRQRCFMEASFNRRCSDSSEEELLKGGKYGIVILLRRLHPTPK